MGRGHRGGIGRGGSRHRQGQPRPAQQAASLPSGEALRVELRASPEFYKALKGRECPAAPLEGSSCTEASPLGTSELQLVEWKDLGALLGWFRDGISADPLAELAFSTKLTKAQRASVHGTAMAVGLGGLGTASRGVGERRRVVVLSKERAVRPELTEQQDHKAYWTWKWALQLGVQVSRDEVAEMILGDGLTPELQSVWEKQAAAQKAVQQLCAAVAAGDAAATAAALDAHPSLLADKVFDVQTGVAPLHLAAKEGHAELAELLLARGADAEARDGHGWTALQVARKYEQSDAEGVLLRAGAHDPEKGKSILEKPATLPADEAKPVSAAAKPAAESAPAASPAAAKAAPAANGAEPAQAPVATKPAEPAGAAPAAVAPLGSGPLSDASSQDVYIDSVASVCGTDRDNLAAEVGSNADDYVDPQWQEAPGYAALAPPPPVEEEGEEEEGEKEFSAAESQGAQADESELAAKEAAEAAATEAAAEEAGSAAAAAEQQQELPSTEPEQGETQEQEEEEGEDGAASAEEDDEEEGEDDAEEEEEMAEEAAEEAVLCAQRAFTAAVAAAEAAEAAAEAAEGMPGAEAAERAAAFRREADAAVAAAAAAAVAAGPTLDDVLAPHRPAPPPPPASSAASVCGSEAASRQLDVSEFGSGPLSGAGSAASQPAVANGPAHSPKGEQTAESTAEQPVKAAAEEVGAALVASGAAAPAVGAAAPPQAAAEPEPMGQAAAAAAADLRAVVGSAAEHGTNAARSTAAAASHAASKAHAELEAKTADFTQWLEQKAPEAVRWVQEHPGSALVAAGIGAVAVSSLLFFSRRR